MNLFTSFAAAACEKSGGFFIFKPWYEYLKNNFDANCNITNFRLLPEAGAKSDLPLVFLAIIDDLLRLAGLIAVAYIIVGGIRFITSQGSPEQTAAARSTIINALVGLVIALIAVSVVTFIGNKLGA